MSEKALQVGSESGALSIAELLRRAQAGDTAALPALRKRMDPSWGDEVADLARNAERSLLHATAGNNALLEEAVSRKLAALKGELGGPSPSPLERLVVERIAVCWLQVQLFENHYAQNMEALSLAYTAPTSAPETLAERLDRLERQHRRLKQLGVLAVLVVAAAASMGQVLPSNVARVVEAERFVLRDSSGRPRALLALADGSPTLLFLDVTGKPRASLGLSSDGSPSLALRDQAGALRASWSAGPDGSSTLDFSDKDGKLRLILGTPADGSSGLVLLDKDEVTRAGLSVRADVAVVGVYAKSAAGAELSVGRDGAPALSFSDKDKTPRVSLEGLPNDTWRLTFADKAGTNRMVLALQPNGVVGLGLYESNGTRRSEFGLDHRGPRLNVLDANGRVGAVLSVGADGAALALRDESSGHAQAGLGVNRAGAGLVLRDPSGRERRYGP